MGVCLRKATESPHGYTDHGWSGAVRRAAQKFYTNGYLLVYISNLVSESCTFDGGTSRKMACHSTKSSPRGRLLLEIVGESLLAVEPGAT